MKISELKMLGLNSLSAGIGKSINHYAAMSINSFKNRNAFKKEPQAAPLSPRGVK